MSSFPLSRPMLALVILASVGFLVLGFVLVRNGLWPGAVTVLFVAPLVFHIQRAFSATPAVEVRHDGIVDNTPNLGVGLIPWAEITSINLGRMGVTDFLDITVRDPKVFLGRIGLVRRLYAYATAAFGYSPIFLNLSTTKGPAADIWAAVQRERMSGREGR